MVEPSLRILVVEGQGELRRVIVAMLKRMGVRMVQNAATGNEAKKIIQDSPIDFILCEWNIPNLSGIEILRDIRTNSATQSIPFVMISARDQINDNEFAESADLDVDGHLIKPISQERLEIMVNSIMEKREKLRESSVHLSRAAAFIDIGAMEDAEAEIESAHKIPPESPQFWVESGKLFGEMGDTEKAKNCYQQAAEVDEGYAKAYEGLAGILEKEGNEDEALKMLQKSVNISPRNRDRQMKMAKTLLKSGDEFGARTALYQAIGEETDGAARNAEAAEFFMSSGRADLAEAEYAFALEADPNNVQYYNRMGLAFRRQKKIEEAVENYRKALSVAPDDPVLHYNLAIALTEGGNTEQALSTLRKALTIQPNFPQAEGLLRKLRTSVESPSKA